MNLRSLNARRIGVLMSSLCVFGLLTSPSMPAEVKFFEEPVVEKKVAELPSGPLYWQLENFPTLAQAQGAAGPTSLAAEVAGKVWLFTLGPKDGATHQDRPAELVGWDISVGSSRDAETDVLRVFAHATFAGANCCKIGVPAPARL
jgi:hypothetical protein